jgi:hypothetical protein
MFKAAEPVLLMQTGEYGRARTQTNKTSGVLKP